jgi:hypothetical protein
MRLRNSLVRQLRTHAPQQKLLVRHGFAWSVEEDATDYERCSCAVKPILVIAGAHVPEKWEPVFR